MTREFAFTREDFSAISAILAAEAGLSLNELKASLVYARLVKRLRALGMENFRDYCALVEGGDGVQERAIMIASLTTHVTSFFREPHHFAHLKNEVLPPLIKHARRGGKVRLWSAGCSSGEEPYSLAITILQLAEDASALDIKILATDIDANVLVLARGGVYRETAATQLGPEVQHRWFKHVKTDDGGLALTVGDAPRALVRFNTLNLFADWPMKNRFDAILCRNVAIYFAPPARARLWRRMWSALNERSYLYVGHSERILDARKFYEPVGVHPIAEYQELTDMVAAAALKVLVVDDQRSIRALVRECLLQMGVTQITECENGAIALDRLRIHPTHLVISDLNMPVLDGLGLLRAVREDPGLNKLSFIMLTSRGEADLVRQAIALKVNNYLTKPFTFMTLSAKIQAVLGCLT